MMQKIAPRSQLPSPAQVPHLSLLNWGILSSTILLLLQAYKTISAKIFLIILI